MKAFAQSRTASWCRDRICRWSTRLQSCALTSISDFTPNSKTWILILPLPPASSVTLDKWFSFFGSSWLICGKRGWKCPSRDPLWLWESVVLLGSPWVGRRGGV